MPNTVLRLALLVDRINRNEWDELLGPKPESISECNKRCGDAFNEIRSIVGDDAFELLLSDGHLKGLLERKRSEQRTRKRRTFVEDILVPAIVSAVTVLVAAAFTR